MSEVIERAAEVMDGDRFLSRTSAQAVEQSLLPNVIARERIACTDFRIQTQDAFVYGHGIASCSFREQPVPLERAEHLELAPLPPPGLPPSLPSDPSLAVPRLIAPSLEDTLDTRSKATSAGSDDSVRCAVVVGSEETPADRASPDVKAEDHRPSVSLMTRLPPPVLTLEDKTC